MLRDLLGRPLRELRVSVTDRCNFRCTYCMPAEIFGERYEFLPREEVLTFEEIARLVRIFVRLGATKFRLTGGEPLLRSGLEKLVARLAQIEGIEDLTLTTNGYFLAEKAAALRAAGLQRVNVSLDTLDNAIFGRMNGRSYGAEKVLQGIEKAAEVGLRPIKIDAVVQRGVNDHTLVELARYFRGSGHILRFIEYMDVGTLNGWRLDQVVPAAEIIERIAAEMPLEPLEPSYRGEVAQRYRHRNGGGEIGVISSVTQPFCGDCSRNRLSADGKMFTCLFASEGLDLKRPLRSGATDEELEALIARGWGLRTDRYSEERASLTEGLPGKVEMFRIGG